MSRDPVLHLPAVPHTVTRPDFTHCAFTGKVLRFSRMMREQGFHVVHYGVGGAESGASEEVELMTEAEQEELLGRKHHDDITAFIGNEADVRSPVYKQFNYALREALEARVRPGDIICVPFGHAHEEALRGFPLLAQDRAERAWAIETGIGYPDVFLPYRIYESEAWRHYHLGHPRRGGQGSDWEWTIPNYFTEEDWAVGDGAGGHVLYFGRLNDQKGLLIVCEVARRRPDLRFVLCGQGDPTFYLAQSPNISYRPPVSGLERARLLGDAMCVIMPSRYVEPFGGVTVEAQLCGTPVLGSVFGSFTETIAHGFNGFRCRTMGDYLAALERIEEWAGGSRFMSLGSREDIAGYAAAKYGLKAVGPQYAAVFETLTTLGGDGYLSHSSHIGRITKAIVPSTPPLSEQLRPSNGPVSEAEWKVAQQFERSWHMGDRRRRAEEQGKQNSYAAKMDLPKMTDEALLARGYLWDLGEARVLDVGCGPVSLLLRTRVGLGVAVDPLEFGPEDEAAYLERGIQRVIGPAEKLAHNDEDFDEGWSYNCLQHVIDPRVILAKLATHCRRIRIFEWLDMPPHLGHPHMLTEALFEAAFPQETWRVDKWEVGEYVAREDLNGRYLAAVLTRRT